MFSFSCIPVPPFKIVFHLLSSTAPRLRLTARLAAAAPAPLLSRSHSTNAIVESNGSSVVLSPVSPLNGGPLPGSSLPALSNLQSTLARRSSVSTSTSQSLPARGLPSLEAIEKRFAQKKEKEKDKNSSIPSTGSSKEVKNDTSAVSLSSVSNANGSSQIPSAVKLATPSDASKENIDPKTGIDASRRPSIPNLEPASVAMSKASSSSSSAGSSDPPATPTDITIPLSEKGAMKEEHPLQHKWTLYYDSRNTTRIIPVPSNPATPTSVGHPNGPGTGSKQQYEAGLSTLATVNTVESFCRLYNWLKKPGKLGLNENMHFFKENILPMWEDENNKKGGKWTICLDPKILNVREMFDKFWMYLCFALVSLFLRLPFPKGTKVRTNLTFLSDRRGFRGEK